GVHAYPFAVSTSAPHQIEIRRLPHPAPLSFNPQPSGTGRRPHLTTTDFHFGSTPNGNPPPFSPRIPVLQPSTIGHRTASSTNHNRFPHRLHTKSQSAALLTPHPCPSTLNYR